ncbi:LINE-1 retrotransposable element ORF2 protein [Canna indica]|uniref:LINE-1 retrotransposable element ORF2 protein n=1 Tax=Canna indica TaxID=4628 RepID=A0AAQ3QSM5_9LILI|nr:LINE-1 retrotransposable element ORF2 protein [Canna indica]
MDWVDLPRKIKILALHLKEKMVFLVDDTQCAFLAGRSTHDCFMAANELIHHCKRTDESAVLVNGAVGKWFRHKRGPMQGDSLSPYLFLLIMDIFVWLTNRANREGMISGIDPGGGRQITNLEFADDFMIFTKGSESDLQNIDLLLKAFELMTGLKVNLNKSEVIHVLNNTTETTIVAEYLGCKGSSESKSSLLVCWEDVTTLRHNGSLRILDLDMHNIARLGKWWWGMASGAVVVWSHIVKNSYFNRKPWQANHCTTSWSHVWKGIYGAKLMFSMGMETTIGMGDTTLFWFDKWASNQCLADVFPNLFSACKLKHGCVAQFININTEE